MNREIYRTHYRGCPLVGTEDRGFVSDGYTDVRWAATCSVVGCHAGSPNTLRRSVAERWANVHLDEAHPHLAAGIAVRTWEVFGPPAIVPHAAQCSCGWQGNWPLSVQRDSEVAKHLWEHDRQLCEERLAARA